jgi:hypothetical protein
VEFFDYKYSSSVCCLCYAIAGSITRPPFKNNLPSLVMRSVHLLILGLAYLTGALANLVSESVNTTELDIRRTNAYRSIAYFVNWVSAQ